MKTWHAWVQGYTAQAAVTHDQIIFAADIMNAANDVRQLGGILARVERNPAAARDAHRAMSAVFTRHQ